MVSLGIWTIHYQYSFEPSYLRLDSSTKSIQTNSSNLFNGIEIKIDITDDNIIFFREFNRLEIDFNNEQGKLKLKYGIELINKIITYKMGKEIKNYFVQILLHKLVNIPYILFKHIKTLNIIYNFNNKEDSEIIIKLFEISVKSITYI